MQFLNAVIVSYWPQHIIGIALLSVLVFTLRDLGSIRSIEAFRARKLRNLQQAQAQYDEARSMEPKHWRYMHAMSTAVIVMLVLAAFGILYAGGFWRS